MQYKTLGNTGLLVSQLCLGTMTFSNGSGIYKHIGNVGQQEADQQDRLEDVDQNEGQQQQVPHVRPPCPWR